MSNTINSLIGYIQEINNFIHRVGSTKEYIFLYRGHAKENYKLKPALFREDNKKIRVREAETLNEIEVVHPKELSGMSTLDKLVMLQHYEFPTRLLDFTFNPLVALFFAARSHKKDCGSVIIVKLPSNEIEKFNSLKAQYLAKIALFPDDLKNKIIKCNTKQLSKALEACVPSYYIEDITINEVGKDEQELAKKIMSFFLEAGNINENNENTGLKLDLFKPIFVETKQLNPRISAQKGAFLLFGIDEEIPKINIETITIKANYKNSIMQELEKFGIDESVMFPGFEHFLLYLRKKINDTV